MTKVAIKRTFHWLRQLKICYRIAVPTVVFLGIGFSNPLILASSEPGPEKRTLPSAPSALTWDAIRPSLEQRIHSALKSALNLFNLGEDALSALVKCEVDSQIKWLVSSKCVYMTGKATATIPDLLERSDGCPIKAGYARKAMEFEKLCMKLLIPNDWAIYEYQFALTFGAALEKNGADAIRALAAGKCIAKKYILELNLTGCKPLAFEDSNSGDIINRDNCSEKFRQKLDSKIIDFGRECIPKRDN
jgi:hypothetical protein